MKPDKNRARGIGFYLLIGVIILAVIFYLTTPAEQKEYTYSEIEELFRQEQVKSFCLEGDELTLNLYSPDSDGNTTIKKTLSNPTWFREDLGDLIEQQTASGVLTEYDYVKGWTAPWWMSILPYLITIVLFVGVWYLLMNKAGGGGAPGVGKFGKAHTRTGEDNLKKVTFADVAGAEEEKEELSEIVDFLKRPQNYTAMGARIPKGVLPFRVFSTVCGGWASAALTFFLCVFAFATVLGWGLYGARCGQFLFGPGFWKKFVWMQMGGVLLGAVLQTQTLWLAAEIVNGLMAVPNLIALIALSPELARLVREYKKKS